MCCVYYTIQYANEGTEEEEEKILFCLFIALAPVRIIHFDKRLPIHYEVYLYDAEKKYFGSTKFDDF